MPIICRCQSSHRRTTDCEAWSSRKSLLGRALACILPAYRSDATAVFIPRGRVSGSFRHGCSHSTKLDPGSTDDSPALRECIALARDALEPVLDSTRNNSSYCGPSVGMPKELFLRRESMMSRKTDAPQRFVKLPANRWILADAFITLL